VAFITVPLLPKYGRHCLIDTVPTSLTFAVDAGYIVEAQFLNHSGSTRVVTLQDGDGVAIFSPQSLPNGGLLTYKADWALYCSKGLYWQADGTNVTGRLWVRFQND
jgi:hypothetical protein